MKYSKVTIMSPVGQIKFYVDFEARASIGARISNHIQSGTTFTTKCKIHSSFIVLPAKVLSKSIIEFSKFQNHKK